MTPARATHIRLGDLTAGQYAITKSGGKPVLCVSAGTFRPKCEGYCYAVHIVNGVGAFSPDDKCRVVSMQEAFDAAAKAVSK